MYFEDSAAFSDGMRRNLVGTIYFIIALCGLCLNLSTLTVLPECELALSRPLFLVISIQLFINIGGLICVGIPVPYMIAVNKPYFVNVILENAPGVLLNLLLTTSFLLQLSACVIRNFDLVFHKLSKRILRDMVVYASNLSAFIFALDRVSEMSSQQYSRPRHFSISSLSFIQSDSEWISLASLVIYASMIGLMFHALSMFDLMYQHIYYSRDDKSDSSPRPLRLLLHQLLRLLCDCIFCVLFITPASLHDSPNLLIIHSLLTIYGTLLWPTFSLILYSENVRQELCLRLRMMTRSPQMTSPEGRAPVGPRLRFM